MEKTAPNGRQQIGSERAAGIAHYWETIPTNVRPVVFDEAGKITQKLVETKFTGIPYAGTESSKDAPAVVKVPTGDWVNNPA